jgi:hypothetical protein
MGMQANTVRFLKFLRENQNPVKGLVERAIEVVTPLLKKIDIGMWRLSSAAKLDEAGAKEAISVATGAKTEKIRLLGFSGAMPDLDVPIGVMTDRYKVGDFFVSLIDDWITASILDTKSLKELQKLQVRFGADIGPRMMAAFLKGQSDNVWSTEIVNSLMTLIDMTLATILIPYFHFAMRGDEKGMDRLEPSVKMMDKGFPLGRHHLNLDDWVVAVSCDVW